MRRTIVGVCLLIASAASPGAAQVNAPAAANTKLEQQLLTLSREKWRLMAEKKADSLAVLFHDQAVFVHMGGHWGTAQELQIIRSGGIWYKHAEIQAASVQIIGPTAIVLNQIVLEAVVGGNTVTNPFEVTEVYVQQGGAWKLAALSFTRLLTPGG
ncbi:MAG TPA: nuclear transport factor 2 family protein [Longimicrobiales bacterium]